MVRKKTRWSVAAWDDGQEAVAKRLGEALGVPPLVARLLVGRGYADVESASRFLYGKVEDLHDPYLLAGMRAAVDRIRSAQERGERVRIYGDYDADGVSATSLLIYLFRELQLDFDYYIPHRSREGYGLNKGAIDLAAEAGVTLLVTVDTGISAAAEVAYAGEKGIDVVVTDHHEPPAQLPDACAIVNPKQPHCAYPFKGLAGVGVAFKLATALLERPPLEWTEMVCLGTIADLMPLVDENRVLVRYGIARLRQNAGAGFRALAEVSGLELPAATATDVAFGMAPRINAAGRLEHAQRAVGLLTAEHYEAGLPIAKDLDLLNRERQRIVGEMVNEAEAQWTRKLEAAREKGDEAPAVIVLAGEGWNVGVVGIVASKLLERHYRPVIILGIDPDTGLCKGSARSIDGFDLHEALTACDSWLDHYGGHQAAAGMTLHRDHLEPFERQMSSLALQHIDEDDWIARTEIDFECGIEEATLDTAEQLSLLEPFGKGNPPPKLLFRTLPVAERRTLGKDAKHLKLLLAKEKSRLDAIGFGMGELAQQFAPGAALNIVGELSVNEWNGQRKAQLQLFDMESSSAERLSTFPGREHFAEVFQLLKGSGPISTDRLEERLASRCRLGEEVVRLIIDVFEELQFVVVRSGMLSVATAPRKRDLSSSRRYAEARAEYERLAIGATR